MKDPPTIKDLSKIDTSSSVIQNDTTDTLVFQTHPTVVASDVMVASPAKTRFCHSGRENHPLAIKKLFESIFGLQDEFLLKGHIIDEKSKIQLLEFISQELYGVKYRSQESEINKNLFKIGSLQMSFNTITCIVKDRNNGMINDELLDLFIDSINLRN